MSVISIYIDEDAMDGDLVSALRSRGVGVVTAWEAGLAAKTDEEQIAAATELGCALYTFNVSDFHRIHMEWADAGREHGGMILASQQRYSVGEQLRRILRLRATVSAGEIRNRAKFVGNWGWRHRSSAIG